MYKLNLFATLFVFTLATCAHNANASTLSRYIASDEALENDIPFATFVNFDKIRASKLQLKPCGLSGAISERVNDCNTTVDGFSLITRSKKFKEVYLDNSTGLIWSALFYGAHAGIPKTAFYDEQNHGFYFLDQAKDFCSSQDDLSEFGGLSDVKWKLPKKDDFEVALSSGLANIPTFLYDLDYDVTYWTNSKNPYFVIAETQTTVRVFNKDKSYKLEYEKHKKRNLSNVRCVGRLKTFFDILINH